MRALQGVEQIARARLDRVRDEQSTITEGAAFHQQETLRQGLESIEVSRAGGTEISGLGVVRSLLIVHPLDELGDDEVHVRIALAMAMRRHVERHAVEERREVGAVVQIEPAHEVLIGLTAARVLRDDQTRDRLQDLARAEQRTLPQLHRARHADGGRIGDPKQAVLPAHDDDLTQRLRRRIRPHRQGGGGDE